MKGIGEEGGRKGPGGQKAGRRMGGRDAKLTQTPKALCKRWTVVYQQQHHPGLSGS